MSRLRLTFLLPALQNVTANHRVNDVIATEDGPQTLVGRFMYGPLDMVTLTGEKVSTHKKNKHCFCGHPVSLTLTSPTSGGHLSHDAASVRPLGALRHGSDQQQRQGRVHGPQEQEARTGSLSHQNGGQVSTYPTAPPTPRKISMRFGHF